MIAVAVAVIMTVILLTGGVVADSDAPGTLEFFGVTVRTTSAQIFLTGAICTWALLAAAWLLTSGIRRSRERGAELAVLRGHAPSRVHGTETGAAPGTDTGTGTVAGMETGSVTGSGTGTVTGSGSGSGELLGEDDLLGSRGLPRRSELPGAGRLPWHSGVPGRGEVSGHPDFPGREPLGRRELAGLLGFAARPGRVIADRSGAGGDGEGIDPGQHPAE